jgi:hypothetical protein
VRRLALQYRSRHIVSKQRKLREKPDRRRSRFVSRRTAHAVGDPAPETLNEVSQNIDQIVRSLGNLLNGLS